MGPNQLAQHITLLQFILIFEHLFPTDIDVPGETCYFLFKKKTSTMIVSKWHKLYRARAFMFVKAVKVIFRYHLPLYSSELLSQMCKEVHCGCVRTETSYDFFLVQGILFLTHSQFILDTALANFSWSRKKSFEIGPSAHVLTREVLRLDTHFVPLWKVLYDCTSPALYD